MNGRTARLAWSLCAFQVALGVATVVLGAVNGPRASPWQSPGYGGVLLVAQLAFPVVGAVIAARQPRNVMGWLFLVAPVGYFALPFLEEYARLGLLTSPGSVPLAAVAIWAAQWAWLPSAALMFTFTLLLFPDGRPPSPRWWVVGGAATIASLAAAIASATAAWPLRGTGLLAGPDGQMGEDLAHVTRIQDVGVYASLVIGLLAVVSVAVRFRRSQGVERQQLKWFLLGAALLIVGVPSGGLFGDVPALVLLPLGLAAPAIATGIAILRHRLYDIDRLLNRTLVYGLLTALLGAAYLAAVAVLQRLTAPLVGGGDLAVAASTLAVAGAFRPLRARVQDAVDRRFARDRYDAARTVEAFRAGLRDAVDLDRVRAELAATVDRTVQPTRVSVWLRE